jgi:hypothetical protein
VYPFLVCFYLMDHLFFAHKDALLTAHDDLGILLGEMDPAMTADGMPIDEAVLSEWHMLVPKPPQSDAEWIAAIGCFLRHYEAHDGFAFPVSLDLLNSAEAIAYLPHAKHHAAQTCRLHSYGTAQ